MHEYQSRDREIPVPAAQYFGHSNVTLQLCMYTYYNITHFTVRPSRRLVTVSDFSGSVVGKEMG